MDKLISMAAALNAIDAWHIDFSTPDGAKVHSDCMKAIREVPAVDAVPVVKCKDCKFGKLCLDADGHRLIQCTNTNCPTANVETWPLELDWFCAGGERRDGDA